jgi:hypothetical protein
VQPHADTADANADVDSASDAGAHDDLDPGPEADGPADRHAGARRAVADARDGAADRDARAADNADATTAGDRERMSMTYKFRPMPELYFGVLVAAATVLLIELVGLNPEQMTDWRTWVVALLAGMVRAAAGAALDYVRRSMMTEPDPEPDLTPEQSTELLTLIARIGPERAADILEREHYRLRPLSERREVK